MMSYGIHTINVHKKLKLDKRANSSNWYARLTLDNGKRIVRSMKTEDFKQAKERALELYYDTKARIQNRLPAQTRKFKHVADFAVQRMQNDLNDGYPDKPRDLTCHDDFRKCGAGSVPNLQEVWACD